MKNLWRVIAFSLLAVLIVLPAVRCVNFAASKSIIVDGNPLPWPQPPQPPQPPSMNNNPVLIVDGNPLPWPQPPQPPQPPLFA
jgi:hypothetical protein